MFRNFLYEKKRDVPTERGFISITADCCKISSVNLQLKSQKFIALIHI